MSDYSNRFASFLNRPFQEVNKKPDFIGQLAIIRTISNANVNEDGRIQASIGRKTQDLSFTCLVEYGLNTRGVNRVRLTFLGSLAEQALADNLKEGDAIHFDGSVQGHLGQDGRLDRRPYVVATWFEKVAAAETKNKTGEVSKSSILV